MSAQEPARRRGGEAAAPDVRSGEALFSFDADLRILSWNKEAEAITGVPAEEAIGRYCWEPLHAFDRNGDLVCHAGCSYARLARDGWAVPTRELSIRNGEGRRWVSVATVTLMENGCPVFLHLLRDADEPPGDDELDPVTAPRLTPRQTEVLGLLADGVPAKVIAVRLGVAEITVRNHIRGILRELGAHSQLEALAKARRYRLLAS